MNLKDILMKSKVIHKQSGFELSDKLKTELYRGKRIFIANSGHDLKPVKWSFTLTNMLLDYECFDIECFELNTSDLHNIRKSEWGVGIRSVEEIKELGEQLCEYCEWYNEGSINTNQYNMCEGRNCENAYENYLESIEEENNGREN